MEINKSQCIHPKEKFSSISDDDAELFIHIKRSQKDLAERKKNHCV